MGAGTAVTAYAVDTGALPGRSWIFRQLGLSGEPGVVPDVKPGETISGSFRSQARLGRQCGWTIALPPKAEEGLPVAIVLHGRGNDHASAFSEDYLGLDRFLAEHVRGGGTPFALASVDGGETYWHPRASGEDAGAMVLDEFMPLLNRRGLNTTRVGFLGWSMGGYGSLALATRLGANQVAAVAAASPALWHDFEDTADGAFDDAADFAQATLFGRQSLLSGIDIRIDCGEGDPFYAATRDYVAGFSVKPSGGFQRGDHTLDYWRRLAPSQLGLLGRSFASTAETNK
ncbi:alpha/beta hydrolase-fold protein [Nocardioides bruguierae]|uniref:alpha/beta hydrolase-fold protein n=1 Tax=Nocardioides bruguierae TaxID=2945102 RepID=UPI002020ED00|nr:alpha/beta hydrolase-fold protein [Nocardioides bruguierae]MCL8026029.1 alpha/beta hydrolase-fold protein [Nocardioides bruguierae]